MNISLRKPSCDVQGYAQFDQSPHAVCNKNLPLTCGLSRFIGDVLLDYCFAGRAEYCYCLIEIQLNYEERNGVGEVRLNFLLILHSN